MHLFSAARRYSIFLFRWPLHNHISDCSPAIVSIFLSNHILSVHIFVISLSLLRVAQWFHICHLFNSCFDILSSRHDNFTALSRVFWKVYFAYSNLVYDTNEFSWLSFSYRFSWCCHDFYAASSFSLSCMFHCPSTLWIMK